MSYISNESQVQQFYNENPNFRQRHFDRRAFVFSHSQGLHTGIESNIHLDLHRNEIAPQDFFNLDDVDVPSRNMQIE
jgi:hypothetical protein